MSRCRGVTRCRHQNRPATRATTTTGTLMMKTDPTRSARAGSRRSTGPSATATPATADHSAMAMARSRASVKTLVRIDSVAGMISAAPMPITARAATSAFDATGERRHRRRRRRRSTRPMLSAPLRPKRSPRLPAVSNRPANTSVYESTTHCSWLMLVPRSRTSVGSATLTIVLSITITNKLRHSTARVSQRRRCTGSSTGTSPGVGGGVGGGEVGGESTMSRVSAMGNSWSGDGVMTA